MRQDAVLIRSVLPRNEGHGPPVKAVVEDSPTSRQVNDQPPQSLAILLIDLRVLRVIFLFEFSPSVVRTLLPLQTSIASFVGLRGALPRVLVSVVCVLHTSVAMGGERPGICSPIYRVVFASACPSVYISGAQQGMSTCRCRHTFVLVPINFGFSQLMFARETHIDTSIQISDIDVCLTATLSHTTNFSLSPSLSLSLFLSFSLALSLSLSLSRALSLSLSHTHTFTFTLTLSVSVSVSAWSARTYRKRGCRATVQDRKPCRVAGILFPKPRNFA